MKPFAIPLPKLTPLKGISNPDIIDDIRKQCVIDYVRWKTIYEQNLASAYQLIWGQCSDLMREKIKSNPNDNNFKNDMDALSLTKAIKGATFKFKSQRCTKLALVDADIFLLPNKRYGRRSIF
eukprot:11798519-Ditylum_brightwellii.AAC.2